MSYIELQASARRKSRTLVLLMAAAVIAIVLEIFVVVRPSDPSAPRTVADDLSTLGSIAGVTLAFIGLAALYKSFRLRDGGPAVAKMLGGRPVPPETRNPSERVFRNVVEELAVAASLPVPSVYVLVDEPALNAFAAGHRPDDAAIAVTRGALEALSRDELQGVVAHEFAHIRNGDMRLNTRLIALQFGILAIGMTGLSIALAAAQMRARKKEEEGLRLGLAVAGLVLAAIGFLGVLKARLIQAAVSRQREFLADASAVKLTRNSAGLVSALRKIAASACGSTLRSAHAGEIGHLLFGAGRQRRLFGLFDTHPATQERIRRLER